ncbi:amino acid permease-associated region [Sulfobacillus acidophilus TPY]|uniref:Amino acid permease-associated region n=1 Tax=Sulfobacillus acidophilus (strain ATCC 700253 / DSM 10332 / NAL) TaxID=679936 RepID=G8TU79_SULAD|nr:amino acid permease-associated region [Sulfobacillus acidophilus TPY]AEW05751.1 amino acid permease-associated region [Sulfobacillus acidophilus DSM 10332]
MIKERRFLPQLSLPDLSVLSISSVAPLFSIAAAGQLLVELVGPHVIEAIMAVAVPFILSATIFRVMNQHFPHAGASYHWSRRVLGVRASHFQSWILLMAYFWSIPPIVIPAAEQTLALLGDAAPAPVAVVAAGTAWMVFSGLVLWLGSRVTAWVTQGFLLLEVAAVVAMGVLGLQHWHPTVSVGRSSWSVTHLGVAMVVAATIVDGWEIDSYAAEESRKPRHGPGTAGLIGALAVLFYYGLAWTVLLHNVPVASLAASPDVLLVWAHAVLPRHSHWALVPILASTAGSLWLTTFILSRALYAMGRDRLLPAAFSRLNRFHAPAWAIFAPAAGALLVVWVNLIWPSVNGLFQLVLSSAGFFLVLEFLFDSITASVFLGRPHRYSLPHSWDRHRHRGLRAVSFLTAVWLVAMVVIFLRYGGQVLGHGLLWVIGAMLAGGVGFMAWAGRRHRSEAGYYIYEPDTDPGVTRTTSPPG